MARITRTSRARSTTWRSRSGPEHPHVALTLNNLLALLVGQKRYQEAEPMTRRQVNILLGSTHSTGREHPDLSKCIANYALLLQYLGYSAAQVRARLDELGRPFGLGLDPAGLIRRLAVPTGAPRTGASRNPSPARPVSPDAEEAFRRGESCRAREQWGPALDHYSVAIQRDPQFAEAYFRRGNIKLRTGGHDEAIADYIHAVCLDPDNAAYRNNRGRAFLEAKQPRQAIADCDAALRIDPRFAVAHFNRGLARAALGDHTGALADFARCLELEPDNPTYRNQLETAQRQSS